DGGDSAPAHTAIGGVERADGGFIGVVGRYDDRAIGADDRLAADDAGVVGRGHAPGGAAVGRAAHLHAIAGAIVIPLRVAVAVERAGRCVVADDPVLVGADHTGGVGDGHRGAPRQATVGRAAGVDTHALDPA